MPIPALLLGLAIPLVKQLAAKFMGEGLNLAASAITGGGLKAKEFIEEKTGLNLDAPDDLTSDDLQKIKSLEEHPEHQLELQKLSLEILKEKHRHTEAVRDDTLEDIQGARSMYTPGALQDKVAKDVFRQTAWLIPILFVLNGAIICLETWGKLPKGVGSGLTGIIGVAIGHSYNERKTLVEFCFGGALGNESQ